MGAELRNRAWSENGGMSDLGAGLAAWLHPQLVETLGLLWGMGAELRQRVWSENGGVVSTQGGGASS